MNENCVWELRFIFRMAIEEIVQTMVQDGLSAEDYFNCMSITVCWTNLVQKVFNRHLIWETSHETPQEWTTADADTILEMLKRPEPVTSETLNLNLWFPSSSQTSNSTKTWHLQLWNVLKTVIWSECSFHT